MDRFNQDKPSSSTERPVTWARTLCNWPAGRGFRYLRTASARDREYVTGLGADAVIDYRQTRLEEVVPPLDVVLDTVGHLARACCGARGGKVAGTPWPVNWWQAAQS
jgi:hypothetical protein